MEAKLLSNSEIFIILNSLFTSAITTAIRCSFKMESMSAGEYFASGLVFCRIFSALVEYVCNIEQIIVVKAAIKALLVIDVRNMWTSKFRTVLELMV